MKIKIYLMLAAAVLLASCSGEHVSENGDAGDNLLELDRIETFGPIENFPGLTGSQNVKRVQTYENGVIISDIVYDESGNTFAHVERTITGNVHVEKIFNAADAVVATTIKKYDGSGRLIEKEDNNVYGTNKMVIGYNADGTIDYSYIDPATGNEVPTGQFTTSASGVITSYAPADAFSENMNIVFDDTKPVQLVAAETGTIYANFTYYTTPVPANLIKSPLEINNIVLESGQLNYVAHNCNYYLQSTGTESESFFKEFNTLGYQTHTKYINPNLVEVNTYFYYHNDNTL